MIVVRKVEERLRQRAPRRLSPLGKLGEELSLRLYDLWLAPGEHIELDDKRELELITYVVTGTLAHAVGPHTSALLGPGELQRVALGLASAGQHTQINPSLTETTHVVQLLVHDPRRALDARQEQRRFSLAQRRGLLCAVAMPSAAPGLLHLHSEITLYSSVLDPGQHLVHGLAAAHSGMLHVVSGELSSSGYVLAAGDTVFAQGERALACTAREPAEVFLGDALGLTSF